MLHYLELFIYFSIVFMALVWWWLRFLVWELEIDIVKAISSSVSTIENIIDLIIPWYYSFSWI